MLSVKQEILQLANIGIFCVSQNAAATVTAVNEAQQRKKMLSEKNLPNPRISQESS